MSGTRIIVQDGIYEKFMTQLLDKVASIRRRMGDRVFSFDLPNSLNESLMSSIEPLVYDGNRDIREAASAY